MKELVTLNPHYFKETDSYWIHTVHSALRLTQNAIDAMGAQLDGFAHFIHWFM